ncbi:hypothetical protein V6N12_062365 [Hibiscus sabdariffa]|uniref:Integrase catalytic domain-containing protein n=1 Tax=Hibiscus sabdariffa TaxID=183260 RepID=A0ABR2F8K8_9ROSI
MEKLDGINFLDWFRNLRIVLKQERKEYVIEEAVPNDPGANAPTADKDKFKKHMDDMLDVGCLMLATMTPELQKQQEDMVAYEMIQNLKEIYEGQARQESERKGKKVAKSKGIDVKKAIAFGASVSGIYVIDVNMSTSSSWVLDTGCGSHICTSGEGLHMRRNLAKGDVDLRVGNGARVAALANQHGKSIKALRSDRGGEYLSQDFDELLKECGIVSQLTPPGMPEWNGVSERRN